MTLSNFKSVGTDDLILQKIQDNISRVLDVITKKPIIDGMLLTDIFLTATTPLSISHLLGRKLVGYIVVLKDATADIWDLQSSNTLPDKFLVLESSANTTITIWVF